MEAIYASIVAEVMAPTFWSALLAIIMIDLVLGGDNAIVIGLAARNVPKHLQKKVILWGTFGAVIVRVVLTTMVVWLLKIPVFMLVGGSVLVWIAYKLVAQGDEQGGGHSITAAASMRGAIQTIVIADAAMGIDNVLAVGGAAHGSIVLVVLGLAISIPIIVWGSTVILKLVDRFPIIIEIGASVLAWTAASMITKEPLLKAFFAANTVATIAVYVIVFAIVLFPWIMRTLRPKAANDSESEPVSRSISGPD